MADNSNISTDGKVIEFRLTSIERTLAELKDVMLDNKMQERDIQELAKTNKELLQAINAHDQRIRAIENRPTIEKAQKWQTIADYIFKTAIVFICGLVATRLNIGV